MNTITIIVINTDIISLSLPIINTFSWLFCAAYLIVLIAGIIFAIGKKRGAVDITLGSLYCTCAITIVLSSNMFLIFCLIELMIILATALIFNGRNKAARSSGVRYFVIHVTSGFLILIGLLGSKNITYPLQINNLAITNLENLPTYILLVGLLVNVAAPPFSSWLPDSYVHATPTGSIFLTAYTSKTACFLLLKFFLGSEVLVYVGIFMAMYGIVYALLEVNIRRLVCFILISNLGLILIFIGYGTADGLYQIAIAIFNSTVYIALLMLCASFIVVLTDKNFYDEFCINLLKVKWFLICGLIGILSLISFPFTTSYITKISIIANINREDIKIWLIVWNTGMALTAVKLVWCLSSHYKTATNFPNSNIQLTRNNALAGLFLAGICVISVFIFQSSMPIINWHDIIKQLESICVSVLAFYLMVPMFYNMKRTTLNFDWLYRVALCKIYLFLISPLHKVCYLVKNQDIFNQVYNNKISILVDSKNLNNRLKIKYMIEIMVYIFIIFTLALLFMP